MHTRFDRLTAYALCVMNFLAHRKGQESKPVTACQIAEACRIREGILRKSLLQLSRAGLVHGTQGQGYFLSARGKASSVLDVVEAMQGNAFNADGCYIHDGPCPMGATCAVRALFQDTQAMIRGKFADLAVRTLPVGSTQSPVCFLSTK